MAGKEFLSLLAIAGGIMLAVCIDLNSTLSAVSSPLFASWVAHGMGAVTAAVLIAAQFMLKPGTVYSSDGPRERAPLWSYLGGVPGGLALLFAIVVASTSVGFSTTISLMIAGQICFGIVTDQRGWFGLARRKLDTSDFAAIGMVSVGSMLLIYVES